MDVAAEPSIEVGRHTYGHEKIAVRHRGEPAELTIGSFLELLCSPRIERFLDSQEGRHGRQRLWRRLLGSRR